MKKCIKKKQIAVIRFLCVMLIIVMAICMAGCGESKNEATANDVSNVSNSPDTIGAADSGTEKGNQVNSYVPGNITEGVLAKVDISRSGVGKVTLNLKHDFSVESFEASDIYDSLSYVYGGLLNEQGTADIYTTHVEYLTGDTPLAKNPGLYKRAIAPWVVPLLDERTPDQGATKLTIDITITDGAKFDDKFLTENPDPVAGISDAIIDMCKDMILSGIIGSELEHTAVVNGEERVILGDASAVAGNNSDAGSNSSTASNTGTGNNPNADSNSTIGNSSSSVAGNGAGNSSADITGVADAVRIKIYHNFCDGAATEIKAEVLESNCADIKVGETIAFYENGSGSDKDCLEMECGSLSELYFLGEDAVCSVVVKRHNCKMANETVHPVWNVTNPIYWAVSRVL